MWRTRLYSCCSFFSAYANEKRSLSKPAANVTRKDIIATNKEKVKDSLLNKLDHKDRYLITLFGFPYSDSKKVH
jgi:hypothetical protein